MRFRYIPAIWLGKFIRLALRVVKPGGGSAAPGFIINRICPSFLDEALSHFPGGIAVVSGSVGKSTTTRMLTSIIKKHGKNVHTNTTTSNIRHGLVSDFLSVLPLHGKLRKEIAVLEMDEGHGASIFADKELKTAILNNVVPDQTDRFYTPEIASNMLQRIGARVTDGVIVNHDDASLRAHAETFSAPIHYFGVSEQMHSNLPAPLGLWKEHPERLQHGEGTRVLHCLGNLARIEIDGKEYSVRLPASGTHYALDAAAAISAAKVILREEFKPYHAIAALDSTGTVFGRDDQITVNGTNLNIVTFQNPASFAFNVAYIPKNTEQILFALGTIDKDLAYMWSTDISDMPSVTISTGEKAHEAALMLTYSGVDYGRIEPNLKKALDDFLELPEPSAAGGRKTIFATLDMMYEIYDYFKISRNKAVK